MSVSAGHTFHRVGGGGCLEGTSLTPGRHHLHNVDAICSFSHLDLKSEQISLGSLDMPILNSESHYGKELFSSVSYHGHSGSQEKGHLKLVAFAGTWLFEEF